MELFSKRHASRVNGEVRPMIEELYLFIRRPNAKGEVVKDEAVFVTYDAETHDVSSIEIYSEYFDDWFAIDTTKVSAAWMSDIEQEIEEYEFQKYQRRAE